MKHGSLERLVTLTATACFLSGCTTSHTTRTYSDPSMGTKAIISMAILPVRNAPIAQAESIRMNRELAQTVQRKNPSLQILGPVEAIEKLNEKNLVDDYDRYVVALAQSGIPNREILSRIGAALGVDALMQGQLVGLAQKDGAPYSPASTVFVLRYSIVSTKDGMLLWETSEEIRKKRQTIFSAPPPLEEVLPEAVQRVEQSIPTFAFVNKR